MIKNNLDIIVHVLNDISPVLMDFFTNVTATNAFSKEKNISFGLGLSVMLNYARHDSYCIQATFLDRSLTVERGTFSMGNFGNANDIKINYCKRDTEYYAYYSESNGGYARMIPRTTSIEVA